MYKLKSACYSYFNSTTITTQQPQQLPLVPLVPIEFYIFRQNYSNIYFRLQNSWRWWLEINSYYVHLHAYLHLCIYLYVAYIYTHACSCIQMHILSSALRINGGGGKTAIITNNKYTRANCYGSFCMFYLLLLLSFILQMCVLKWN